MAISLADVKRGYKVKRKDEEDIINTPQISSASSGQTISLADIRNGKSSIKPIINDESDTTSVKNEIKQKEEKKNKKSNVKKDNPKMTIYNPNNPQLGFQSGDKTLLKNDISHYKEPEKKKDTTKIEYKDGKVNRTKVPEENILSTINNGLVQMGKGIARGAESLVDTGLQIGSSKYNPFMYLLGDNDTVKQRQQIAQEMISDNATNRLMDKLGYNKKLSNGKTVQEQIDSDSFIKSDKFSGQLLEGVGNMLPSIMLGNMGAGTVGASGLMGLNSYGSAIDEAYNEGANRREANLYGLGSAAVETATEYLTGGIPGVSKVSHIGLDNLAEAGLRKIPNRIVREAARIGYKAAGEGLEEGVTEIINPFLKNATYSEGEKIDWDQVKKAAAMGTATGLVLNGPADFYNMNQAIKEQINSKPNNVQKNVQNNVANEELSTPVQNNTVLNNENNNISNQTAELNLKQSAQNYNIDVNNETINSIDQTLSQRGIKAKFDSNAFINSNENAFWQLNEDGSREVVFNPNAKTNDLLENVAVHELYHDIANSKDGKTLRTELLDFAKTKEGYEEARKSLEQLYSNKYDPNSDKFTKLIDEEAVASILGKKLGNQEFVNSLTVEKPSLAKNVYNWVVDKLNKLNKMTGYKSEKLFWKDVKNKFDSAYRSEFNKDNVDGLDNDMLFSKGKLTSGEDIVVSDDINGSRPSNKMAEKTLKKMLGITYVNNSNNNEIIISNKDIKKYLNDGYNNYRNAKLKKRIAGNYGEVIELAKINSSEPNYKNSKRGKQGYDYYDVNLAYPIKDSYGNVKDYKYYTARLVVRKDNNSNFAYDLDKFTEKKGAALDKTSLSITTGKPVSSSFSENNIPNSNQNVKSGISTKYSMQENQNNVLDNSNIQRYDDLSKTNYIEYFRKDNGDVRVNLMDSNNNLVNQLDLVTTTDAIKQFGERLGNQLYNYATDINQRIDVGNDINNLGLDTDYFMNHRPTQTGLTADDITNQNVETPMPKDMYDNPEYYFQMNEQSSKESMAVLRKIRGNPNAEITIYRATPGNKINSGDWITLSKSYAEWHNQSQFDGKANILQKKVKAKDVQFAGDDINEFGYFPNSKKYSQSIDKWNQYLDTNFKSTGKGTTLSQLKPNKVLNPSEIANLIPEDANTTPKLKNVKVEKGTGNSSFYNNLTEKSEMLTLDNRARLAGEEDIQFYKKVTNKDSLDKAYKRLNDGGRSETMRWLTNDSKNIDSTDVAEGWILLKQYQDAKDYNSMVQVAKKMREMGTKSGQAVQAYNIMSRLTPEGMVKYAQSELQDAYDNMIKNKTKKWIEKNRDKFELTPDETAYIIDNIKEASKLPDGYDKKVKLAQIQSLISNKLPPTRGAGTKAWMRISMLFNPKTQIRNILGNAVITPVNAISDTFSSLVDKQVSKKTGVRTTGAPNVKNYAKGFKKGLYESYNDFKLDINTRDMQGNRFEIGEGKSFNNNTKLGKALNQTDHLLSFMLDAGDRPFYEATFTNSINNQKILNNTDVVTQDMIDIATTEALQRTWQDNNAYTKFVLETRKGINKLNVNGYGLGDVLIPFAKTPANLTKAIVDYSPVGIINVITDGVKLKNAFETNQFTPKMQHKFVQDLGKATAGTMLYVLGYALAKANITTGESDEDKDVANFMKNTLGVQSYSIKIGDKSFTYDWAQPVAAPFAMMANLVNKSDDKETDILNKALSTMDTGMNLILQQSFMESIQNVLSNYKGITDGIVQQIADLPSRAVPTFVKQINDMIDPITRTSFEKDEPIETAKNKVKSKVPGLSKELAPTRDTLGREIKKYGGDNNIFNVFLNPANTSKGRVSESAKEIYKIYQETGDKTIMPRVAPYSIMSGGKSEKLDSKERSEFQKISGQMVEENVKKLAKTSKYKELDNSYKAEAIKSIVDYSYNYAKSKILNQPISSNFKKAYEFTKNGGALYDFYADKIYKKSKEK